MILIIFDVDGTLVNSNRIDSQCFAQAYSDIFRKPFPSIDWTNYPHVTDTSIFNTLIEQHFNREPTANDFTIFQDHFLHLLTENRKRQPEAFEEILNARITIDRLLQDESIAVGIATGGWNKPAKLKLKHVGINYDALYMTGADGKITRESILSETVAMANKKHPNFSKIVYIGDAIWDVQTTRNMQMDFVGIRHKGDYEVLQQCGTQHVLKDYSDFDLFMDYVRRAIPPNGIENK